MPIVGPTFFSSPTTTGDGLTRLQTVFAGASAADTSDYSIGSGTSAYGTLVDGSNYWVAVDATLQFRYWLDAGLILNNNSPLTAEMFFTDVWTNNTASAKDQKIGQMNFGDQNFDLIVQEQADQTTSRFNLSASSGGMNYAGSTDFNATDPAYKHHAAFVARANGTCDFYLDGVRIVTGVSYFNAASSTGYIQIFGRGTQNQTITATYYGVRVRRAEMYTGASFTPPAGPEAWSAP